MKCPNCLDFIVDLDDARKHNKICLVSYDRMYACAAIDKNMYDILKEEEKQLQKEKQ